MNDLTAHEVLVKGWNLIDRYGHAKGDLGSPARGFCAQGAINYAALGDVFSYGCSDGLVRAGSALGAAAPNGEEFLAYNNAPERTKEEIRGWFMAAIAATAPKPDLALETRDPYMEACHQMAAEWDATAPRS